MVKVEADAKIRYERLIQRSENTDDQKKTYEEFLSDQNKEADAEIPMVMENAKESINNNQDFNDLYHQIDNLINKLNS